MTIDAAGTEALLTSLLALFTASLTSSATTALTVKPAVNSVTTVWGSLNAGAGASSHASVTANTGSSPVSTATGTKCLLYGSSSVPVVISIEVSPDTAPTSTNNDWFPSRFTATSVNNSLYLEFDCVGRWYRFKTDVSASVFMVVEHV